MRNLCLVFLCFALPTFGGEDVFSEYRDLMGDDNPAIFVIEEGEELWFRPQGPLGRALDSCDLGLGPGVTEGAYANLPRYFGDTEYVMDVESRLIYCMVEIQGRELNSLLANAYSLRGDFETELEAIVAWLAAQSEGLKITPKQTHPEELDMYLVGERIFFYRAGPHDFSCATCHEQANMRIRLQSLPSLTSNGSAAQAYGSWPAYRISQGLVRTMGWRLRDCFRQQRWPELKLGSPVSIALQTYMAVNAEKGRMSAPGLKR